MNRHRLISSIIVFQLVGCYLTALAQTYTLETVPNPKQARSGRYVSNPDGILSASAVRQIDSVLRTVEDSTTAQVAVVCLNSIGENVPKDFATALFRKWGLGYRQKNNGLLVLMVKDQHRFEMETGYGLEGILPDAICKRIQTEHMVPFAKVGNFDQAMIAGIEALAHTILDPNAAQEVYDKSKFEEPSKPLDDRESLLVLYFFLWIAWMTQRLLGHWIVGTTPVRKQIEAIISGVKGRRWRASLLNGIIPIILLISGLYLSEGIPAGLLLLGLYAYITAVKWDSRRRRQLAFTQAFGKLSEPDQYVRRKAVLANGWLSAVLFPIPFWAMKRREDQLRDTLRNHPRQSPEGYELTKLTADQKGEFLTDHQRVEEKLKTVEYDVWYNEPHQVVQAIGYENLTDTTYQQCNKCHSKAMHSSGNRVVKAATTEREGRGINDYVCDACGHHRETSYAISIIRPTTSTTNDSSSSWSSGSSSSSSSSSSDSSSSSSSSSSWGGGSSGGGGAGSDW